MTDILVDHTALRAQVQQKYSEVALDPKAPFHFHTGRSLASRLGYPAAAVDGLPDSAVESFAGVGSPFALRDLEPGERVVDVGCGAGFDTILAAGQVGPNGRVIGVDMTPEMLDKARRTVDERGLLHVEIREGLAERAASAMRHPSGLAARRSSSGCRGPPEVAPAAVVWEMSNASGSR